MVALTVVYLASRFLISDPTLRCDEIKSLLRKICTHSTHTHANTPLHKANRTDRITCARTGWKVRYATGRVENKRGVRTETSSANQRSRSPQPS
ncbi:hypothetical protein ACTXT7_016933, partial [Hymenolepis weldensis]